MAVSYYSSGGPWGVADGNIPVYNQTVTQTIYFQATSAGTTLIKARLWFAGNGVDAYQVQSAYLQQGAVSVPVTVNGAISFLVPAFGRFSDYVPTTSFSLPGNVNFVTVVKLKIPWLIPIVGGGDDTQTGPSGPGAVTGGEQEPATDASYLVLNFDGPNGSTSFTESVTGLVCVAGATATDPETGLGSGYDESLYLSTEFFRSGISSLALSQVQAEKDFWYNNIPDLLSRTNFSFSLYFASRNRMSTGTDSVTISLEDGNGYSVINFIITRNKVTVNAWDYANSKFIDAVETTIDTAGYSWIKIEAIVSGTSVSLLVNDSQVASGTATVNIDYFDVVALSATYLPAQVYFFDSIRIANTAAPGAIDTTEVTSTATITVTDNSLIDAGDTITITETGSSGQVNTDTYTFVDSPTGAPNEIVIGPDASTTAANIADTITDTIGAEFTATTSGNVVTVVKYTDDTVVITDDSDGITVSSVSKSITYTSSSTPSTIPPFTASGTAFSGGDLGDNYVNAVLAPLYSTGESTMSGNNGSIAMPAFTSSGLSFMKNVPSLMTDAEKVAMLMYENEWVEWLASMIVVPGDPDDVALVATQWVASNITYATDLVTWGTDDYWIDPRATVYYGVGDAEDGATLLASILINSGVNPDKVRVYFGEDEGVDTSWVMYQRVDDNQWVVLDWMEGSTYWNAISDVNDLDPQYPKVQEILDFLVDEDDVAYGQADEYVDYEEVVSLISTKLYADSIYAETYSANLDMELPAVTIRAEGGGYLTRILPSLTISATGAGAIVGKLSKNLPSVTLVGSAILDPRGDLSAYIPAIRILGIGIISPTGSLERNIPEITLTATAYTDIMGSLNEQIGAVLIDGNSYWMGPNDGAMIIPSVRISALARAIEVVGLCLNTKNYGLTKYTSYAYDSVFMFNGKLVGMSRTGIYELEGSDDAGTPIYWKIKTPMIDLKTNKLRYLWLSGKVSDDAKLAVELPDGTRYEYDIENVSETEDEIKVKVGKGLGDRYVSIEMFNEAGQTITLDKLSGYGMPGDRR